MFAPQPPARWSEAAHGAQDRHDGEIDALALLRILRRNLALIVIVTVAGTLIAAAATMFMTPLYSSTAVVRVDPSQPSAAVGAEAANAPRSSQAENAVVEGNVALLESPPLIREVANELNLGQDPEFADAKGPLSRLKGFVRALITPPEPDAEPGNPNAAAAGALMGNIEAHRVGLTYLVELTAWSVDPEKAARLANTTVDVFLQGQIESEQRSLTRINDMLTEQIAELRERLQESEQAFQRYRTELGFFNPEDTTLNDQRMISLNEELTAAQARVAEAKAKYEQLSAIAPEDLQSAAASPEVLSSEVVANLRTAYADAARRAAEQSALYGPNHPASVQAQAELGNVSTQIEAEMDRIVASARTEYEMAEARRDSVEASLEEVKSTGGAQNHEIARLNELQREAEANREVYQAVLQRAKETAAAHDLQVSGVRVVSAAVAPGAPSAPQRTLIVALAFAGSLGLAVVLVAARELMRTGLRGAEDLRENFGLYPLASVPLVAPGHRGPGLIAQRALPRAIGSETSGPREEPASDISEAVLDRPESAFSESIRSLRFSLKRLADLGREMRVVLITSALPGEGKSTVAASLAREAAAAGERVLLIDADLRRPDLAATLDLAPNGGLTALLSGEDDISGLIQHDRRAGVHVIGGSRGVAGARALQLLSSGRMSELLRVARQSFDLVVIDTGPLVPIADPRVLVDRVDGVVMVVAADQTSRDAVMTALHETPGLNNRLVGMVLNRMAEASDRYAYGSYQDKSAAPGRPDRVDGET